MKNNILITIWGNHGACSSVIVGTTAIQLIIYQKLLKVNERNIVHFEAFEFKMHHVSFLDS